MRKRSGELNIEHARLNNLKDVSVTIPKGVLTAVSGVDGSGKSSLILGCLPQAYPETVIIDQNLASGARRPNTATYTGILDNLRKTFAKANAVDAALFSANSTAPARTATGWASSIPTSPISTPWSPPARPAMASASCPKCWSTGCEANPSATSMSSQLVCSPSK